MAKRTVGKILDRAADHLGDDRRDVFKRSPLIPSFKDAWEWMYDKMRDAQLEAIEIITTYTLTGGTTSLSPLTASITSLGQLDRIEERPSGSSEKYREMDWVEQLPQRDQYSDRLAVFEFRGDNFHFVGATSDVQLRITYKASGDAPTAHDTIIDHDNAQRLLAFKTAAFAGPPKGYGRQAKWCEGQAEEALQDFIRTKVRDQQNTQMQQPAYSAGETVDRRRGGRPPFYN